MYAGGLDVSCYLFHSMNVELRRASSSKWMTPESFLNAVSCLPLVSVDWVLCDPRGMVLTGYRLNSPARFSWFTPGGRIRIGERLSNALFRVLNEELGVDSGVAQEWISRAELMGAWDHFYSDSAFSESVATHYVNLPHFLTLGSDEIDMLEKQLSMLLASSGSTEQASDSGEQKMRQQHSEWRWVDATDNVGVNSVHPHVQPYLQWVAKKTAKPGGR